LLSQISCRGASDPISKPQLWESFAEPTPGVSKVLVPVSLWYQQASGVSILLVPAKPLVSASL
jgi:hypothetical protein